jgi:hypothetical protein
LLAREANRFLDERFKYRSGLLQLQRDEQELLDPTIFVPQVYRSLMGYASFLCTKYGHVSVVTQSQELEILAASLNVPTLSLHELLSR